MDNVEEKFHGKADGDSVVVPVPLPSPDSPPSTIGEAKEWDPKAARRAVLKVDSSVLPLLFLGLLVFQLDRMNIASAITGGMLQDIKINQATVNLGNQLMFMSIVILEIPFNMLLQRWGPRKWLSIQVFIFGLIATLQVFVKNRAGFLAARCILGLAEAGYIPGGAYTLSSWYTNKELARRVAVFFFGMFGGNAISPLLASGILQLHGAHGLHGWQYIFLIEGLFTIGVAFLIFFFLPGSPQQPRPLGTPGLIRFSSTEAKYLQDRLEVDNTARGNGADGMEIPWRVVWRTVSHYKRWLHFVSTFAVFSTWAPLTTYTPSIIKAQGFDTIQANALAAVGAGLALVVVFGFAYMSDKTNQRGASVITAHACYLITLIVARQMQPHVGKWARWGLWTAVNAFAVGYHPVSNTWVQLNCRDPRERNISIAMWVMSAITGLMCGSQYYQAVDAPMYLTGLRTQIIMVAVGMVTAAGQIVVYKVHNRKIEKGEYGEEDPMVYVP